MGSMPLLFFHRVPKPDNVYAGCIEALPFAKQTTASRLDLLHFITTTKLGPRPFPVPGSQLQPQQSTCLLLYVLYCTWH